MSDPYEGREQSEPKHIFVEQYLEKLAYKVLYKRSDELAFIDAFSGPWQSSSDAFRDTSFGRALRTLKKVQAGVERAGQRRPKIRCIFVERKPDAFQRLKEFVEAFHDPDRDFYATALNGNFEELIPDLQRLSGSAFRLTFIDPTGWTGYAPEKIAPLLKGRDSEVLINFMYDYVNRFAGDPRREIRATIEPILGPNYEEKLRQRPDREQAIIELFCNNLKSATGHHYVLTSPISKPKSDRTYFLIAFETNSYSGLKVFRDVEHTAQMHYAAVRAKIKFEDASPPGQATLFDFDPTASIHERTKEFQRVRDQAREYVLNVILVRKPEIEFKPLAATILLRFPLRETDVKQICKELAKEGLIEASWKRRGTRFQTPANTDQIRLIDTRHAG